MAPNRYVPDHARLAIEKELTDLVCAALTLNDGDRVTAGYSAPAGRAVVTISGGTDRLPDETSDELFYRSERIARDLVAAASTALKEKGHPPVDFKAEVRFGSGRTQKYLAHVAVPINR